jgi:hypothetical protein
MQEGRVVA